MTLFNKLHIMGDWFYGDGFGLSVELVAYNKNPWWEDGFIISYSVRVLLWYCIVRITYNSKGINIGTTNKLDSTH